MSRQRTRDTTPELALRRVLHAQGYRYRVDYRPLPEVRRRADLVFTKAKVAVFVHGCFWHRCPVHATQPKANAAWWAEKLSRNVSRDSETREQLKAAGWTVIELWEHEDPEAGAAKVKQALVSQGKNGS